MGHPKRNYKKTTSTYSDTLQREAKKNATKKDDKLKIAKKQAMKLKQADKAKKWAM